MRRWRKTLKFRMPAPPVSQNSISGGAPMVKDIRIQACCTACVSKFHFRRCHDGDSYKNSGRLHRLKAKTPSPAVCKTRSNKKAPPAIQICIPGGAIKMRNNKLNCIKLFINLIVCQHTIKQNHTPVCSSSKAALLCLSFAACLAIIRYRRTKRIAVTGGSRYPRTEVIPGFETSRL